MYRIFIVFIFLHGVVFAQYSPKEIDSLMTKEYYQLREERKFEEIITLSRQVIKNSRKINYLKGEIYGYTRLGNMLYNIRNYKEALKSLNYANELVENSNFQDNTIRASIHLGIGLCYSESGLSYHNKMLQYDKALFFAEMITNSYEKDFYKYLVYSNFYGLYSNLKNKEKEIFYLRKALSVKQSSYMLTELARYHNVYTKNIDSARFYLEKSQKYADTDFARAALYNQWGRFYEEKKEYIKAIEFYKKNEFLARKTKEAPLQEEALIGLSYCYKKIGNLDKAMFYSEKRNVFKDSIKILQMQNSTVTVDDILNKSEKTISRRFSIAQKVFIAIIVFALIVICFFVIKIYKNQKERKKVLDLMEEKEEIISLKEEEAQELKLKVNESFEEVIQLAKTNSPEFLTRF